MSGRKSSSLLTIIAIVALCIFCVPLFVKLIDTKKQGSEEQEQTYVILDVYEAEAKFKEESMTIDLLSGCVKSNQQVDKIFINVNGYGTEYLDFKASLITTEDDKQYIAHALTPRNSLLSAAFASNRTLTILKRTHVYARRALSDLVVQSQRSDDPCGSVCVFVLLCDRIFRRLRTVCAACQAGMRFGRGGRFFALVGVGVYRDSRI